MLGFRVRVKGCGYVIRIKVRVKSKGLRVRVKDQV